MKTCKRGSVRVYPRSDRVAWAESATGPLRAANVLDYSATGIGLVFTGKSGLHHGSVIRTMSRRSTACRRARIVRIQESLTNGMFLTTLGCRWISSIDRNRNAMPRRLPRA